VCSSGVGFDSIKVVSISSLGQEKKYQICSYFFTVNGLALDERGNLDPFTGHSLGYSPSQRVQTVPGDYLAFNSIGFADIFVRNGVNLSVHIRVVMRTRMFTAIKIPLMTSWRTGKQLYWPRKPNTSWVNMYYFMICITCKPYTK